MPTTSTTYGAPLPVDTDAADLAKAMADYANDIEPKLRRGTPFAMAAGVVTAKWAGGVTQNVLINYPTARFTVAPILTVAPVLSAGYSYITARIHSTASSSGAYVTLAASGGNTLPTTGSVNVAWQAVQMQSGQAAG